MKNRTTGQFYGNTNQTLHLNGLTITDTIYTHHQVDWHYHEHPYFTFILDGKLIEGNKKEIVHCGAGTLLFHNWQDPHYNIKPPGYTRGFHIELDQAWINGHNTDASRLTGSSNLKDPRLKQHMYQIFKEVKLGGAESNLAVTSLLLELLHTAGQNPQREYAKKPHWVNQLKELLFDENTAHWSLKDLSQTLSIHPVHLSAEFPKHFHCGIGHYIRALKMERALGMLPAKNISLTQISLQCGFADQSHFNRTFKAIYGLTPLQYRKLI
jgi:AraC family transcriptional regulator